MSHDDIEDLVEKLEAEKMMYCIAINQPETSRFTAQDSIKEAIDKAMDIDGGIL